VRDIIAVHVSMTFEATVIPLEKGIQSSYISLDSRLRGNDKGLRWHENYFIKSQAVVEILRDLGGVWTLMSFAFSCIPCFIRDKMYDHIARNRHSLYACEMSEKTKSKKFLKVFLD